MTQLNALLTQLRTVQTAFLNETCRIDRLVLADTDTGQTEQWVLRADNVKCRLASLNLGANIRLAANTALANASNMLTMPFGTVCEVGDRITINGKRFQVLADTSGGSIETAVRRVLSEDSRQ